jgi:RNA polymerase sigma-70 factor (ECF subfamily)
VADNATYLADIVLVDRCLDGEQAAARELFRREQAQVHGTLYRIVGSNADMDDLIQETFVQVFRSLKNFGGRSKLSTWIHRIAVRVAYRHLRRYKELRSALPEMEAAGGVSPSSQVAARHGLRRFYKVLEDLTPAARVAFVLHTVEGLPVAEVAEVVGASVTATKVRIWRARKTVFEKAAKDPALAEFLQHSQGEGES